MVLWCSVKAYLPVLFQPNPSLTVFRCGLLAGCGSFAGGRPLLGTLLSCILTNSSYPSKSPNPSPSSSSSPLPPKGSWSASHPSSSSSSSSFVFLAVFFSFLGFLVFLRLTGFVLLLLFWFLAPSSLLWRGLFRCLETRRNYQACWGRRCWGCRLQRASMCVGQWFGNWHWCFYMNRSDLSPTEIAAVARLELLPVAVAVGAGVEWLEDRVSWSKALRLKSLAHRKVLRIQYVRYLTLNPYSSVYAWSITHLYTVYMTDSI